MSCLIDGVLWNASEISVMQDESDNLVDISCQDVSYDQNFKLSFICTGTGTVNFMKNNYDNFGLPVVISSLGVFSSNYSSNPTGQVVITEYDKAKKTISGKFHFDAHDNQGNKKSLRKVSLQICTFGFLTLVPDRLTSRARAGLLPDAAGRR
ncbi:MAG: hypothetical protein IPH20_07615 [Bacteroidales bacterium]|nr:hypothetical protein [Bacteroidales bacterium]